MRFINMNLKRCAKCGKILPESEFSNKSYCRTCYRDYWWQYKYGISPEQYLELFDNQKGKCAICGRGLNEGETYFNVDHDHSTGEIRGLLCSQCNRGLGAFKDNVKLLEKAVKYLKENND